MNFKGLDRQYQYLKKEINTAIENVCLQTDFISGKEVVELEEKLASYVGRKYCVSCANGTDALFLALRTYNLKSKDVVFVPNFTFFSTAEVVAELGAIPIFVDVDKETFNISPKALKIAIKKVLDEGKLNPRGIIPVDLFGLPANYIEIEKIAKKNNLFILEDGAQGFGGRIRDKKACSFGDISTTSFFPAKPLGCYGDGGAIFTDDEEQYKLLCSLRVHGKGDNKYDNVRLGLNSRLDTLQAALLIPKFNAFDMELVNINKVASLYYKKLEDVCEIELPIIPENYYSSYAQFSIKVKNEETRTKLMSYLKDKNIPTMIYYPKTMSAQKAFAKILNKQVDSCPISEKISKTVLALPIHPYMTEAEVEEVVYAIKEFYKNKI